MYFLNVLFTRVRESYLIIHNLRQRVKTTFLNDIFRKKAMTSLAVAKGFKYLLKMIGDTVDVNLSPIFWKKTSLHGNTDFGTTDFGTVWPSRH